MSLINLLKPAKIMKSIAGKATKLITSTYIILGPGTEYLFAYNDGRRLRTNDRFSEKMGIMKGLEYAGIFVGGSEIFDANLSDPYLDTAIKLGTFLAVPTLNYLLTRGVRMHTYNQALKDK